MPDLANWFSVLLKLVRTPTSIAKPVASLALIAIACLVVPSIFSLPPPTGGNVMEANQPAFTARHLLGTDDNGNDMASRLLTGGRNSLLIAVTVNVIGLCLGGTLGAISGWFGGAIDDLIMRLLETFIAIPSLVLVMGTAQLLGPGFRSEVLALACFSVPAFARLSRSATVRVRELPFILNAQLSAISNLRILSHHILPHVMPQLVTFGVLGMGIVINIEGAISFLGLGMPPPQPTLGNMIYHGQLSLSATPMLVLLPSTFLFVSVLCFNILSDSLRRRWNLQ